jgi:hypothetical protein
MSEAIGEDGFDALTNEDWQRIEAMATEYDDELSEDLEQLLETYEGQEGGDDV